MSDASKTLTVIYRSEKKPGAYLYTRHTDRLEAVPELLLEQLGNVVEVMTLLLTSQRKLAHADVNNVMQSLIDEGFYLQLPPAEQKRQEKLQQ